MTENQTQDNQALRQLVDATGRALSILAEAGLYRGLGNEDPDEADFRDLERAFEAGHLELRDNVDEPEHGLFAGDLLAFVHRPLPEHALEPKDPDWKEPLPVRAHFFLGVALEEEPEEGTGAVEYNPTVETFAYDITRGDLIGDFASLGSRKLDPREVRVFLDAIRNNGTYFDREEDDT